MAETVKVPAIGSVKKKWVLAGLGVSAGIVGWAWWHKGTGSTEPAGEGDVTGGDLSYTPDAYSGATGIPGGSTVTNIDPESPFGAPGTNAEWSQRLVDLLEGVGFDRNFAASTIGKYLSGNPLTTNEALSIQTGLALLGNPPAGALPIVKSNPAVPPPPATGGTAKPSAPSTLNVKKVNNNTWQLSWSPVSGATNYEVRAVTGHTGDAVRTVSGTSYTATSAQRAGHLAFEVRAKNANGVSAWKRNTVVGV